MSIIAARYPENALSSDWINTPEAFAKLRDEWNELLKNSNSDTLFLTWEWLHTWWLCLANTRVLSIITVRQNGTLIGVAPLTTRPANLKRLLPFRALEFLGSGNAGSDYLDVIVRRGAESEVVEQMWSLLDERGMGLELQSINGGSVVMTEFSRKLKSRGWQTATVKTGLAPRINLAEHDWESYMAGLKKSHRAKFAQKTRKIHRDFNVRLARVDTEEQRDEALQILISLHMKRWDINGGSTAFDDPALKIFHERFSAIALKKGWLRLYVLWLDDEPAAAIYGFMYNKVFYYYQSGFEPDLNTYSPGYLMVGMTIQSVLEEGGLMYDFLRGDESYKSLWKNDTTDLSNQEFYPARWRGDIRRQSTWLRNGFKRLVWNLVPSKLKT